MSNYEPTAANALRKLFEESQDTLSVESLEWLSHLSDAAELEADNISAAVNILAFFFSTANQEVLPLTHRMAMMLYGLGDRLDMVSQLISVSREARFLADNKKAPATSTTNEQGGAA